MFSLLTVFVIATTVLVSFLAFNNHDLFARLSFYPYRIWRNKEWYRIITHGFIHVDLGHLFFNMFALFSFGSYMEQVFGIIYGPMGNTLYLLMYFIAIVVAGGFELFTRRDDYNYHSVGASGGVSAIIFAYILPNPFGTIGLFFIPIPIPAYIFGILYLVYCVYMAKRGQDNIGHTAHFTGAVFGFFFPAMVRPQLLYNFFEQVSMRWF